MINITKYKNKETVEYELEVNNKNKIIFSAKVEIEKDKNTDDKVYDRIAKIKLLKMLLEDGTIEVFEELINLIPVYLPKANWTEEVKEEYLRTQKEFFANY